MLPTAEGRGAGRATPGWEGHQLPTQPFRAARHADPFRLKLLLESDVQVGDDEDVVRHEGRLIRHGLELHVRSKRRGCSIFSPTRTLMLSPRTNFRAPPSPLD